MTNHDKDLASTRELMHRIAALIHFALNGATDDPPQHGFILMTFDMEGESELSNYISSVPSRRSAPFLARHAQRVAARAERGEDSDV